MHAMTHVREFGPGILAAVIGIAASVIPAFLIHTGELSGRRAPIPRARRKSFYDLQTA